MAGMESQSSALSLGPSLKRFSLPPVINKIDQCFENKVYMNRYINHQRILLKCRYCL